MLLTAGGNSNENGDDRAVFMRDVESQVEWNLSVGDVDLFKVEHPS